MNVVEVHTYTSLRIRVRSSESAVLWIESPHTKNTISSPLHIQDWNYWVRYFCLIEVRYHDLYDDATEKDLEKLSSDFRV